jgi:hypothetical protein
MAPPPDLSLDGRLLLVALMFVDFLLMSGMIMVMRPMLALMLMTVHFRFPFVSMFMAVLMRMFMLVRMGMLMAVFLVLVGVLMVVLMSVFVGMLVFVLMLSFHNKSSFFY